MLKIRELRESLNLSQDQMVTKTGIPKRSYVNYESGHTDIPLRKLQDIASALNVTISDLVEDDTVVKEKKVSERSEHYPNDTLNQSTALIRNDIKMLSDALYQPLKDINDGVFKMLLDQQKVLRFIDNIDLDSYNQIGSSLREFLKEK